MSMHIGMPGRHKVRVIGSNSHLGEVVMLSAIIKAMNLLITGSDL